MNLKRHPRYIYIGTLQEEFRTPVKKILSKWEEIAAFENFSDFEEADEEVLENAEAIITYDFIYNSDKEGFLDCITDYSDSSYVGLFDYGSIQEMRASDGRILKDAIIEDINRVNDEKNSLDPDAEVSNDELCYYFIDPQSPVESIDHSLHEFINSGFINAQDTIACLTDSSVTSSVSDEDSDSGEEQEVEQNGGKIVTVTSTKGGAGKSTTSFVIATYLAIESEKSVEEELEDDSLKVLLVDMDVKDNQLSSFTKVSGNTVVHLQKDLENNNGVFTNEILKRNIHHVDNMGIDVLLAPNNALNFTNIREDFYLTIFSELRKYYDFIILDTMVDYTSDLMSKVVYPSSDKIIFVAEPNAPSVNAMSAWINYVTKRKSGPRISRSKVGIILNKYFGKSKYENVNLSGDYIFSKSDGIAPEAIIPNLAGLVASATNSGHMEWLIENPGYKKSMHDVVQALAGKIDYKLPPVE